MKLFRVSFTLLMVAFACQYSFGQQIEFDFLGNAGSGLLPGNENPPAASGATGDEFGTGLVYDNDTNTLVMLFEFNDLTGGLDTGIASGMHLHLAGDPNDPLGSNGGIVFNLNDGTDPNVTFTSGLVANGAVSAMVEREIVLTEAQEDDLFASRYYLNIHSAGFASGELRGNLVAIPEPATVAIISFGFIGIAIRRRRS